MGKGFSAPMSQGGSRFGNSQRQSLQTQSLQRQSPQSQYASPLSGLGAIYGQYQQPSQLRPSGAFTMDMGPQRRAMDYSGDSYIGASPKFPEVFYPVPRTQSPPQYQQPNPYAAPFQQRYVQPTRLPPAAFVPKSAKDYMSPFGVQKEQTYYDLTRGTKPPPAPVETVTAPAESVAAPAFDYGYSDYVTGDAAGGVVKAAAGRYLQGPGDGTSDSIPATIGNVQPARLADGEFVIDARTVSEIGNGSSNAGARKLYAMMERVHRERKKAKRGQNSNADRFLPR